LRGPKRKKYDNIKMAASVQYIVIYHMSIRKLSSPPDHDADLLPY